MAYIQPYGGKAPRIHPSAFVAPTAVIVGDVEIGAESSIWFGAVLRGDEAEHGIVVGVALVLERTLPLADPTVVVVTGGNIDPARLAAFLSDE